MHKRCIQKNSLLFSFIIYLQNKKNWVIQAYKNTKMLNNLKKTKNKISGKRPNNYKKYKFKQKYLNIFTF